MRFRIISRKIKERSLSLDLIFFLVAWDEILGANLEIPFSNTFDAIFYILTEFNA